MTDALDRLLVLTGQPLLQRFQCTDLFGHHPAATALLTGWQSFTYLLFGLQQVY
jgi:hypothetical protein